MAVDVIMDNLINPGSEYPLDIQCGPGRRAFADIGAGRHQRMARRLTQGASNGMVCDSYGYAFMPAG